MKKLLLGALFCSFLTTSAFADAYITVKNNSSEDCSVAFHARIDKTKWLTVGWYVFASGEEAPVILNKVQDNNNIFVYNDCINVTNPDVETKKAWILPNHKFIDEIPRNGDKGYEEVTFIRLNSDRYNIGSAQ